jgi:maleylacetoacetate isomerase
VIFYDYWRSSAAYRVRIALALKGVTFERRPIHLLRGGGEQLSTEYLAKNPQGLVPALELDDGTVLTQSLAIIEYLDAVSPDPPLLPADPVLAAKTRAAALAVACEIHPLANLRVVKYLESELGVSRARLDVWRRCWISRGLEPLERMIAPAPFCFGAALTLADICLIPQLYNARRFEAPLDDFPRLLSVEAACARLAPFRAARPEGQSDAEL